MGERTALPWKFDCEVNELTNRPFAHIWSEANSGRLDLAYLSLRENEVAANAAFIVKACNAHDGLVEALQDCLPLLGWRNGSDEELRHEVSLGNEVAAIILQARAALAALEGK